MKASHKKIVYEILPRLAEKLKEEGMIMSYDTKQEPPISISKDLPEIKINPDLMLHLPNGKKILVEVANPRDPKRFIGELIYPKILTYYERITAAMVFVLNPQERERHKRSLSEDIAIHECLGLPKGSRIVTWPGEDEAYRALKDFVARFKNDG